MARVRISNTERNGDYEQEISFEIKDSAGAARAMCRDFLDRVYPMDERRTGGCRNVTIKIGDMSPAGKDIKHDVVAIYDNAGIPSFMHRFRKTTNKELFGGSEKTNAAFIIGGEEYDEIYISVYENCEINGKPYSLPYQKPWTNITNDDAAKACFSKGEGWHLMTRPEWGLLANLCLKNGTLPHGNTSYGKYHANVEETGEVTDGGAITLTGSGPATWTHNHTPEGVHDLCGNIWEMVRGMRLKNGRLQAAKDNDAAMDINLSAKSTEWQDVLDDMGNPVRIVVDTEGIISITSAPKNEDDEYYYGGSEWGDVEIDCISEQLTELALYAGEPESYLYVDSTSGEYLPICGGRWYSTGFAGVFYANLYNARTYSSGSLGFRSAYYRKSENLTTE